MRLACVKHAASVRSEPGSNSQVHLRTNHKASASTNRPELNQSPTPLPRAENTSKRTVNAFGTPSNSFDETRSRYIEQHPIKPTSQAQAKTTQATSQPIRSPQISTRRPPKAPPTYPFHPDTIVKEQKRNRTVPRRRQGTDRLALRCTRPGADRRRYPSGGPEARGNWPSRRSRDLGDVASAVKALSWAQRRTGIAGALGGLAGTDVQPRPAPAPYGRARWVVR